MTTDTHIVQEECEGWPSHVPSGAGAADGYRVLFFLLFLFFPSLSCCLAPLWDHTTDSDSGRRISRPVCQEQKVGGV